MVAGTKMTPSALKAARLAGESAVRGAGKVVDSLHKGARKAGEKIRRTRDELVEPIKDKVKAKARESVRSKRERPRADGAQVFHSKLKTYAKVKSKAKRVDDE